MKKLILSLLFLLTVTVVWAQVPQQISYQSVIRDGNNVVVASSQVGIKISLLKGSATGPAVYVETHRKTTNANGLVSLEIGTGTVLSGSFASIDWANGPYLIQTETDPMGGTNYSIPAVIALNSVPYALYAANGTPGPKGDKGDPGTIGDKGDRGATGLTGSQGPIGLTGPAGAVGDKGDTGASGPTGVAGPTGPQGIQGLTGATGSQGPVGLTGPAGPTGVTGLTGATGPQGPIGLTGLAGPQGATGSTGAAGAQGIQGPTGATGAAGPAPSGTGLVTVNNGSLQTPGALTGDVTTSGGGLATTIGAAKVTNSMLAGSIDLTSKVTGALPVANGGTGSSTKNFVDLSESQTISGTKTFNDYLTIASTTSSSSTTSGAFILRGGAGIGGNVNVGGTLAVTGASTFTGLVKLQSIELKNGNNVWEFGAGGNGEISLHQGGCCNRLQIDNNGRFAIGANYSPTTFQFDVEGNGRFTQDLTAAGLTVTTGNVAVNTNKFTVAGATGNTTVAGTLDVSGKITAGTVTYPNAHNSTSGQVLTINNAGTASWASAIWSAIQNRRPVFAVMARRLR